MFIKGEKKKIPHLINNMTHMPVTVRPKNLDALFNHIQTYMRVKRMLSLKFKNNGISFLIFRKR